MGSALPLWFGESDSLLACCPPRSVSGHLDRSMKARERRHDLGGEPPDALPGGLSAVEQDVFHADCAQGFEFCTDSVGRAVERTRLSRTRCAGISRDVRLSAPVRMLR